jgi:hypothetical protein
MLLDDLYKEHKRGFLKQKSFKDIFDIQSYPLIFKGNSLVASKQKNKDITYGKLIKTFDFIDMMTI